MSDKLEFQLNADLTPKQKARLESLFKAVEAAYIEKRIARLDTVDGVTLTVEVRKEGSTLAKDAFAALVAHNP